MKIYEVVFKDSQNAYREVLPCENYSQLVKQWGGNGEIIYKKDITNEYTTNNKLLTEYGIQYLQNTLKEENYNQDEIDILIRTLRHCYNF